MMRAVVFQGVRRLELAEVPEPECPPDGALLQVRACGICGTDVRTYLNGDPRAEPPWILGHEVAGILIAVGDKVQENLPARPGDAVVVISTLSCGQCEWCRRGYENLCESAPLLGYRPYQGAYAEYMPVPPLGLRHMLPIPEGVSFRAATLADPLSDVINGQKDLHIGPGDVVVVLGAGPIGTMHAQLALAKGATRVFLVDLLLGRLELASYALGGDRRVVPIPAQETDPVAEVRAATGGRGADVIIVANSSAAAQRQAVAMAAKRGRIVFFGGLPKHNPETAFDANFLHYRELAIFGAYASTYAQQKLALALIREGVISADRIITRVVPLERTPDVFEEIVRGEALKVVVEP